MCDDDSDDTDVEASICGETLKYISMEHGEEKERIGGSARGKRGNRNRGRAGGHRRIVEDYFLGPDAVRVDGGTGAYFNEQEFERRFRMPRRAWDKLRSKAMSANSHFAQKRDAAGLLGASGLQKMASATRQLARGLPADATTEHCRISEAAANRCVKEFCSSAAHGFKGEHLGLPTAEGLERIEGEHRRKGLPGAIGRLGCAGWERKNCPKARQGARMEKSKLPPPKPGIRLGGALL